MLIALTVRIQCMYPKVDGEHQTDKVKIEINYSVDNAYPFDVHHSVKHNGEWSIAHCSRELTLDDAIRTRDVYCKPYK